MKPTLLDTGAIVALLDSSEREHSRMVRALDHVDGPLFTCEAVIAESCYLLRSVPGAPEAILQNVHKGNFMITFDLCQHIDRVAHLMKRYRDQPMDLADACLVTMAEIHNTPRILTVDGDFEVYRFQRNRRFQIL